MKKIFREVAEHFCFTCPGQTNDFRAFGSGHINSTYRFGPYCVQRMNEHVFRDLPSLMENIVCVTGHIRKKLIERGGNPARECLNLVPTIDGEYYYRDVQGGAWRAFHLIEGAASYDITDSHSILFEAGKAFGRFLHDLADMPARLSETIPDFHNTPERYRALMRAADEDVCDRRRLCRSELAFASARSDELGLVVELLESGLIPERTIHNDTKLNNVLIDNETSRGLCVLDLDTVMPGSVLYDFGDALRAAACTAEEDEKDLSLVRFCLERFAAMTEGFISASGESLTKRETELLPFSCKLIAIELGMRFLCDFLEGDSYFPTTRPLQNLDRCRVQFRLAADIESKTRMMTAVVKRCLDKSQRM